MSWSPAAWALCDPASQSWMAWVWQLRLTLSRIESGKYTSRKKPVDLSHLVASAVDAIRPLVCEADSDQLEGS